MITSSQNQKGAVAVSAIVIAIISIFAVSFAGLSIWAYLNYMDQKNNVDSKIDTAVAEAEKNLGDKLEKDFIEREKEPLKSFAGPSDYGTLGFKYPKTWNVYVATDGSDDSGYEAFFSPGSVPPVEADASRYALHVTILNESYEDVVKDYESQVKKGDLKTSPVKANDQDGTRLDGNFSKDIRGAAVLFKIRDKTAIIQTEADTFKADFDALIQTISFVQ